MKTFLRENWYKLMIGFSMVTFSLSALIYCISPAMANDNTNIPLGNKGVIIGDNTYFVDGGYVYRCSELKLGKWKGTEKNFAGNLIWEKSKLP